MAYDPKEAFTAIYERTEISDVTDALAATGAVGRVVLNAGGQKNKMEFTSHGKAMSIVVQARKWYDFQDNVGGIGPISLTQHALHLPAAAAVQWIVENVSGCPVASSFNERRCLAIAETSILEEAIAEAAPSPRRPSI